jgi:hypothetical protein
MAVSLVCPASANAQAVKPWVTQLSCVFVTHTGVEVHLWPSSPSLSCWPIALLYIFLILRHSSWGSFPLLDQLPQLWNVIRRRFHGLPSCVTLFSYVLFCCYNLCFLWRKPACFRSGKAHQLCRILRVAQCPGITLQVRSDSGGVAEEENLSIQKDIPDRRALTRTS